MQLVQACPAELRAATSESYHAFNDGRFLSQHVAVQLVSLNMTSESRERSASLLHDGQQGRRVPRDNISSIAQPVSASKSGFTFFAETVLTPRLVRLYAGLALGNQLSRADCLSLSKVICHWATLFNIVGACPGHHLFVRLTVMSRFAFGKQAPAISMPAFGFS